MTNNNTEKIKLIKKELQQIGEMRPGSLTQQKRKIKGEMMWPYWQLSYTQNMKSKTEYVRDEFVEKIKEEIVEYKKFKSLMEKWVELSVELSRERMKLQKKK